MSEDFFKKIGYEEVSRHEVFPAVEVMLCECCSGASPATVYLEVNGRKRYAHNRCLNMGLGVILLD